MPQMAPMWWLTLMLIFNLTFILMNTMIYFNYKTDLDFKMKTNIKKMNWKW